MKQGFLVQRPSEKVIIRLLVLVILCLALAGGFFHAQLQTLKRRYDFLVKKYDILEAKMESEARL